MFSYDAVGCFEKMKYTVSGTGQALIEPFLDNMVAYKNTDKKPLSERCAEASLFTFIASFPLDFGVQESVRLPVHRKKHLSVFQNILCFVGHPSSGRHPAC